MDVDGNTHGRHVRRPPGMTPGVTDAFEGRGCCGMAFGIVIGAILWFVVYLVWRYL